MKRIGKLRHKITIQKKNRVPDGMGGWTFTWDQVAQVWAEIKPFSANERFRADKIEEKVDHRITFRAIDDIDASMRITFRNRAFEIRGIIDIEERERFQEILAEEIK